MIQVIERILGGRRVVVQCAPEQTALGNDLMSTLQRLTVSRPPWAGMTIRFGWSLLRLREERDGRFTLCEPDFLGEPLAQVRPRVDITLSVLAAQSELARAVGIVPVDVGFEQFVVVGRGALQAPGVTLLRTESLDAGDSGWSLDGGRFGTVADEFDGLRACALLSARPAAVPALILPVGFAVNIQGRTIVDVFDSDGNPRLAAPFKSWIGLGGD